jgi:hypothetical protein
LPSGGHIDATNAQSFIDAVHQINPAWLLNWTPAV